MNMGIFEETHCKKSIAVIIYHNFRVINNVLFQLKKYVFELDLKY